MAKSKVTQQLSLGVSLLCLQFVAGFEAQAQSEGEGLVLESVVVTATKREASVQDIPASVTAFDEETIRITELTNNRDLQYTVPGLVAGYFNGSSQLTLRGIGANSSTGIDDPAIAQHIDGVYQTRTQAVALALTDLERVEVLKGPQGTLYGRNSTGGAINYVTKKPTDEFEGSLSLTAGNYGRIGANLIVSGPLSDTVSARGNFYYNKQDGYLEIAGGGGGPDNFEENSIGGRLALRFTPSDDLTIDLAASTIENESVVGAQLLAVVNPAAAFYLAPGNHSFEPNELVSDANADGEISQDSFSATIGWEINENWSLKSITGYSDNAFALRNYDVDYSSSPLFPATGSSANTSDSLSQEFNLNYTNERVDFVAGLYYLSDEFEQSLSFPIFGVESGFDQDSKAWAVFADIALNVTDQLTLLGGIRYNDEEKEVTQTSSFLPAPVSGTASWDATNPKFGFQYYLGNDAMVYGTWQQGFKAGGYDPAGFASEFNPEEIEAIEFGLKTSLFAGAGLLNISVFDYDYTDLQVQQLVGLTTVIDNAGSADVRGLDAEFQYAVTEGLRLELTGTFLDTEVNDLAVTDPFAPPATLPVDVSGSTLRRAPDFSGTFALNYDMSFNNGSELQLRAELYHSDDVRYRFLSDEPFASQDAYTTGNIYANFSPSFAESLSLRAYVKNIRDEEVLQGVLPFGQVGLQLGNYTRGRTFGLEARYDF